MEVINVNNCEQDKASELSHRIPHHHSFPPLKLPNKWKSTPLLNLDYCHNNPLQRLMLSYISHPVAFFENSRIYAQFEHSLPWACPLAVQCSEVFVEIPKRKLTKGTLK